MTGTIPLPYPHIKDFERLERRVVQLESLVQKLVMAAHLDGNLTVNDVRMAYGLEPWHGKAKGSE